MSDSTDQVAEETTPVVEDVVEAAPDQPADPVAALTADLQRLQAEYANYRKRVERDRAVAHELAIALVLTELLATLDDIDRAASHNELTGGFKAVADQLTAITNRLGLEKYGSEGDAFDPQIHEALMHAYLRHPVGSTTGASTGRRPRRPRRGRRATGGSGWCAPGRDGTHPVRSSR